MINELKKALEEVEKFSNHRGYWYRVQDILSIMICSLLCGIQEVENIHEWSKVQRQSDFLKDVFGIKKIPSRAQFYNILRTVNSKFFEEIFIKLMQNIVQGKTQGKTIAIDGKAIRSTGKLSHDGSVLHIASAIISNCGLIIGSKECEEKVGEIETFRSLVDILDIKGSVVVADAIQRRNEAEFILDKPILKCTLIFIF